VKNVLHMPEFQAIGAACKRIRNILRQAEEKGIKPAARFSPLPDSAPEEKALAEFIQTNAPKIEDYRREKKYSDALVLLSAARERVDGFFDKVMVMVENEKVRANRLALLETLLKEFSTIADFSEIVVEGKEKARQQP
jgi:glycyl-tRNA synthetase beta chain